MPVSVKVHSPSAKAITGTHSPLAVAGDRLRVLEESKLRKEGSRKPQPKPRSTNLDRSAVRSAVKNNVSVDSSCSSSGSCSSGSSVKTVESKGRVRRNGLKPVKVVPEGAQMSDQMPQISGPRKRCDWITPNADPLYIRFHDEEWGVPVRDDKKLFELLVFSLALAELSWPTILHRRGLFRKLFDDFEPSSVASFTEKKLVTLTASGNLLSEPKLRAVVENAKQMLKVQRAFGSFSNYCWSFVNQKPIRTGSRYARQIPAKTPKAELISKDLMQRGFRCVGPTIIYSFMQVAGLVNDHLQTCPRFQGCNSAAKTDAKPMPEMPEAFIALEDSCSSPD